MSTQSLKKKFNSLTLESEDHWDYRGTSNSERDYVHGLCTYPAMMVPKMQREMLDVYLKEAGELHPCLLDPFAGSGTMLVEGMLRGLDVVGIDINPLAILLCKVKTTILIPDDLMTGARDLLELIGQQQNVQPFEFPGISKWFTPRAILDLSKVRVAIMREQRIEYRRFYWAAFCEAVRLVSNSRNCTYKLHIKEQADIDTYDKDAVKLFESILDYNVIKYCEFYNELKTNRYLTRNGMAYRGKVKIIFGDAVEHLRHTRQKYSLVFTSPPYGDNHTTVSYGQYSIMPLRWINIADIDESISEDMLKTLYEIDNQSLGGHSAKVSITSARKAVVRNSVTLRRELKTIQNIAPQQENKIIAFYSDYNSFLVALSKRLKVGAISVWTVGNRKVAKQEIHMDKIMIELGKQCDLRLLTSFTRKILNKRMPKLNAYQGEDKGLQNTMTREHILIFVRSDSCER